MFRMVGLVLLAFLFLRFPLAGEQVFAPIPAMCQVYFSPKDDLASRLVALIDEERESIKSAIYCLTHSGIMNALMRAHKRGVDVDLIIDPQSLKGHATLIKKMAERQIPLRVWNGSPKIEGDQKKVKKSLMHDKFCIFGRDRVWTGSFNFTRGATVSHCENAVVLQGAKIVDSFLEEFERIKQAHCVSYTHFIQSKEQCGL